MTSWSQHVVRGLRPGAEHLGASVVHGDAGCASSRAQLRVRPALRALRGHVSGPCLAEAGRRPRSRSARCGRTLAPASRVARRARAAPGVDEEVQLSDVVVPGHARTAAPPDAARWRSAPARRPDRGCTAIAVERRRAFRRSSDTAAVNALRLPRGVADVAGVVRESSALEAQRERQAADGAGPRPSSADAKQLHAAVRRERAGRELRRGPLAIGRGRRLRGVGARAPEQPARLEVGAAAGLDVPLLLEAPHREHDQQQRERDQRQRQQPEQALRQRRGVEALLVAREPGRRRDRGRR